MNREKLFKLSALSLALLGSYPAMANLAEAEQAQQTADSGNDVERIEITGSRLVSDPTLTTRNIDVIDRDEINKSGVGSLAELLRRLPQNMNSQSSIGAGLNLDDSTFGYGRNAYAGSSANLRGLGAQYTLFLVNGRRPSKGGVLGDVSDLSNIPIERVERVEVLFDGAAAIYGSDAVGGVINIITRNDFDGTEVAVSVKRSEQGGGDEETFSIGHTFDLDDGTFSIGANYTNIDEINTSQRDLPYTGLNTHAIPAQNPAVVGSGDVEIMWVKDVDGDGRYDTAAQDERLSGGIVYQYTPLFAPPGTTASLSVPRGTGVAGVHPFVFNSLSDPQQAEVRAIQSPALSGYSPVFYAQMPEFNGQLLDLYSIPYTLPAAATAEEQFLALPDGDLGARGQSLTPATKSYGLHFDLDYDLTDELTLRLSGNWDKLEQLVLTEPAGHNIDLFPDATDNPFGVQTRFAMDYGLPQEQNDITKESFGIDFTLEYELNDDWMMQLNASASSLKNTSNINNQPYNIFSRLDPTRVDIDNINYGTFIGILRGSELLQYRDENGIPQRREIEHGDRSLNDPLLGFNSYQEMVATLINPHYSTETESSNEEVELFVQGRIMTLPAGDVTTNIVLSERRQTSELENQNALLSFARIYRGNEETSFLNQEFTEKVSSVGGEISVPIFGGKYTLPLVNSLAFHGAYRHESVNYMDEDAENWSVGLNYSPVDWVVFRVNQAQSKALPSSQLILGGNTLRADNRVAECGDFSCPLVTLDNNIFTVSGPVTDIGPEEVKDTVISLQVNPTDNTRFFLTYTEKELSQQISSRGGSDLITQQMIDKVDSILDLTLVTPETMFGGKLFAGRDDIKNFRGEPVVPVPGDYIYDTTLANVKSTDVEIIDFELNWSSGMTEYGEFYLTWKHTHNLSHEVTQNDVCDENDFVCDIGENDGRFEHIGQAVNLLGEVDRTQLLFNSVNYYLPPVPENSGRISFDWGYKGFSAGISTSYIDSTRIYNEEVVFNFTTFEDDIYPFYIDTTPARGIDLAFSLDFSEGLFDVPEWLESSIVFVTIDDIYREDEKFETVFTDGEPEDFQKNNSEFSVFNVEPRGTSYNITFRTYF